MKVLPRGKYDYDLFPITEELIEIDIDGNDNAVVCDLEGVISIDDADLQHIRKGKKFSDDLSRIVDMTEAELAEEGLQREKATAPIEIARLVAQLASMDYLTNKRVEGLLTDEDWTEIVKKRGELRQEINRLRGSDAGGR